MCDYQGNQINIFRNICQIILHVKNICIILLYQLCEEIILISHHFISKIQ